MGLTCIRPNIAHHSDLNQNLRSTITDWSKFVNLLFRSILDIQLGWIWMLCNFLCYINWNCYLCGISFKAQLNFVWRGRADFLRSALRCLWKYFILWKIGKHRDLQVHNRVFLFAVSMTSCSSPSNHQTGHGTAWWYFFMTSHTPFEQRYCRYCAFFTMLWAGLLVLKSKKEAKKRGRFRYDLFFHFLIRNFKMRYQKTELISCHQTKSLQNVPLFSAYRVGNFPTVVNQLLKNVKVH